ncbi:MAG TPA: T9SS type A sorting domain-containing protein [Bacteroidetes bacterium]|nr:T9SS type A sorting domain-containing protein [Bacteroidota bacterium]
MKNLLLLFALFFYSFSFNGQSICRLKDSTVFIHVNNIRAAINNKGNNFNYDQKGNLQVPFNGVNTPSSIYESDLWFTATDSEGNMKYKFLTYKNPNLCGYIPGPWFEGTEEQQFQLADDWNKTFKVTGDEILAHIADASDGQIDHPILSIYAWPGNGNQFFENLNGFKLFEGCEAGFYEVPGHENGIYEPNFGEYPYVKGLDPESVPGAIFWSVYCSGKSKDEGVGAKSKMKLQIEQTVWAMSTDDDILSNTLFTRYVVKNKSQEPYYNYKFGLFVDPDLGCLLDDYVGCIPELNSFYVYNQDNDDDNPCDKGVPGYGENPPVEVVTFLGDNGLDGFYVYDVTERPETDPIIIKYRLMNGKWYDGTPFTYGGTGINSQSTDTVDYVFPDEPTDPNGWSMYTENFFLADRKVLAVSKRKQDPNFVFSPESSLTYDIAYSYHRNEGLTNLENVIYAKTRIPELQQMYSNGFNGYGIENCDCTCVWAGDTDNNGIVTFKDIVNVLKNYGQTGHDRKGAIAWTGISVQDWAANNFTSVNPKYSDVNGDGVINMDDAILVKDFLGNTNLCFDHTPENYYCDEGNEMNWDVEMQDTMIHLLKTIKANVKIPNKNNFMGLYYEIYYDPEIFKIKNIEDFMKWKDRQESLFYNYHNEDKGLVHVLQFNDQNKNLKLTDNTKPVLSIDYFVKRIPITYPTKYTDIKICNATVYYDDGTEEYLPAQTLHLRLPEKVEITGTGDINNAEVKIYPNPTSGVLYIETPVENDYLLKLYDINGKLIKSQNINSGNYKLQLEHLNSGIYFIKISSKDRVIIKKIEVL